MRILCVEDDARMAKTIEILLQQAGHQFDTAPCGEVAVGLAADNEYDLILLDIMLPDFDGFEVMERIRRNGKQIPFLIQTALLDRKTRGDGISFGATEYLVKPFNMKELTESIEKVVAAAKFEDLMAKSVESDPGLAEAPPADERREHRRFKTEKPGRIEWPPSFDCVVLNLSYGGAAIRLPSPDQELAPGFSLKFESGEERKCQVCWRTGDMIGVKFI